MRIAIRLFTIILTLFTSSLSAQPLSATSSVTDATCPTNGTITINASGGAQPYSYSLIAGPVTKPFQPGNVFNILVSGTYTAQVKDNTGVTFNVTNIVVKDSYNDMAPTATAINEICYGSNSGSIKLSFTSGQGTPPYSYSISTDGGASFTTVSSNNNSTSYTFANLAPGTYFVRVTDQCDAYQTRQATLTAAGVYNLDLRVWARPSQCGSMDYYVQPQLGTHYPQTIYAYDPGGNLVQTLTVNSTDLVAMPGVGQTGFKFTLPNPPTYPGTYYTFKYTDACVTDPANTRVHATTPYLGNFVINAVTRNCNLDMDVKVLEGWHMPVTVKITPAGGGTPITQTINDEASRTSIFSNLAEGSYTVEVTDECGHKATQTLNLVKPVPKINTYFECGASLPGMTNLSFGALESWQTPVTATINSGPNTYTSTVFNKSFTATYPISSQNSAADMMVRFRNLAPGTYNITLTDGCTTKTMDVVVQSNFATYTVPPLGVGGCTGSRTLISTATSTCSGLTADVKKGTIEAVYSNGQTNPTFTLPNVAPDVYAVYYYTGYDFNNTANSVFKASSGDMYNNRFLLQKETVTVTSNPINPNIAGVQSARCTDGSISIKLIPSSTTATITGYQMQLPDGTYTPFQSSPLFTVSAYGTYYFRAEDQCLNAGVSAVAISPNPTPVVKTSGNTCIGADITLSVEVPANATVKWIKPNNSTVSGSQLLIPNASAADKGTYKVEVTYTVGSCTEVLTATFTLDQCVTLPVNWGTFTATIKNDMLFINWSTLKETNNSYFEVQVSQDGNTWKSLGKVNSTATNGNSDTEIRYEFQKDLSGVFALFGIPALLGLLALGSGKRNNIIKIFLLAIVISSIVAGCKRTKDAFIADKEAKLWVRIVQVDKDGGEKTTSVIKAVRE